jgi:DNA-binding MarR family transcriptional regulator
MRFYAPDAFTPEVSVGYLARRVYQCSLDRLAPAFAAEGVSATQWAALVSIWKGHTTCAAIARELAYDKGAATRLIDGLEARGWVTRERDPDDRRIQRLTLTEEGRRLALACRDRVRDHWNVWFEEWDRADVETLIALLTRLRYRLEEPA